MWLPWAHTPHQFYFSESAPSVFDEWLCSTTGVEAVIGDEAYAELINVNYGNRDELDLAKRVVQRVYKEKLHGDLIRDRVRDTLHAMLSGGLSLSAGCRTLWDLRLNGALFIPAVFAGYASELEQAGMESYYKQRILEDVREFLRDFQPD